MRNLKRYHFKLVVLQDNSLLIQIQPSNSPVFTLKWQCQLFTTSNAPTEILKKKRHFVRIQLYSVAKNYLVSARLKIAEENLNLLHA